MRQLAVWMGLAATAAGLTPIALPGGAGGIGFDDLRYSRELHRVLVPAGRSGRLDLVDPATRGVLAIAGFSSSSAATRGHSEGTTSADAGGGYAFASDRTRRTLSAVDLAQRRIVATAKLGGSPDYVRWVAPLREIWVTEPDDTAIEMFRLDAGTPPRLTRVGALRVPDGPESLEIDPGRRRAYANTWHGTTIAVDLDRRAVGERWTNGCKGARGLAVDPARGLVFVGCAEGFAVALDPAQGGRVAGRVATGKGVDVIAYGSGLSHLYVPGAASANLTIVGVGVDGTLDALGTVATVPDAHCVTADDSGHVYVCDPRAGALLVLHDPFPRGVGPAR